MSIQHHYVVLSRSDVYIIVQSELPLHIKKYENAGNASQNSNNGLIFRMDTLRKLEYYLKKKTLRTNSGR